MDQLINEKDGKLICLKYTHNEPILVFVMDEEVPFSDRFLCSKCLEIHRNMAKIIPINSAIDMVKDNMAQKDCEQLKLIERQLTTLQYFQYKIKELQVNLLKLIDQILVISNQWEKEIDNLRKKDDYKSLIKGLEQLHQKNVQNNDQELIKKMNDSYFKKLALVFKRLFQFDEYKYCYDSLKNIKFEWKDVPQIQKEKQKVIQINYELLKESFNLIQRQDELLKELTIQRNYEFFQKLTSYEIKPQIEPDLTKLGFLDSLNAQKLWENLKKLIMSFEIFLTQFDEYSDIHKYVKELFHLINKRNYSPEMMEKDLTDLSISVEQLAAKLIQNRYSKKQKVIPVSEYKLLKTLYDYSWRNYDESDKEVDFYQFGLRRKIDFLDSLYDQKEQLRRNLETLVRNFEIYQTQFDKYSDIFHIHRNVGYLFGNINLLLQSNYSPEMKQDLTDLSSIVEQLAQELIQNNQKHFQNSKKKTM